MKNILLCPPTDYDIEYEINPWMHIENKVDKMKVAKEYEALRDAILELPVNVMEIRQKPGLPDMVYAANFGVVSGNDFICANFKYPERQGEQEVISDWIKNIFGFKVHNLPKDIFFEGQGDLLENQDYYFMGWGKRTNKEAKIFLEKILKKPIIDLELVDPFYYHLDMSFSPLSEKTVVIKPESFTKEGLKKIHETFSDVIIPTPEDQKIMACNLLRVNNHIVIGKGISDFLKNSFLERGYLVHEVPMNEYWKGGGSVKCSSFEFAGKPLKTAIKLQNNSKEAKKAVNTTIDFSLKK